MKLEIEAVAHHRNGVCGEPFFAVLFTDDDPENGSRKLAVVFEGPQQTAVFDLAKLAEGVIEFGVNSWRGDVYNAQLRDGIIQHNARIESRYLPNRQDV